MIRRLKINNPGSIKVLRGLEAVRSRPAMYVGNLRDGTGLHGMLDHVIAEALVRWPTRVVVTLNDHGAISVSDNGLRFPLMVDMVGARARQPDRVIVTSPDSELIGMPLALALETAMTTLMVQGTGCCLPVVNALSSRLDLRLWRDGEAFLMRFEDGEVVAPLARVEPALQAGGIPSRTFEITFRASTEVFGTLAYRDRDCEPHRGPPLCSPRRDF